MTNNPDPFALSLDHCGTLADAGLRTTSTGSVVAVFERCFYIGLDQTFICIGNRDFTPGPLNAASSAPARNRWPAGGLATGDRVQCRNGRLRVGNRLSFDLAPRSIWRPPASTGLAPSPPALARLEACYHAAGPDDGLAPLVFERSRLSLPRARRPLVALSQWLAQSLGLKAAVPPPSAAVSLLGLGPGLTPSGDDFLAAMLIALRAFGEPAALAGLTRMTLDHAPRRTNPISAQHLSAAAQGLGSGPFHDLLAALQQSPTSIPCEPLHRLTQLGHTSGWDALAGLYTTLKIYHQAGISRRYAA